MRNLRFSALALAVTLMLLSALPAAAAEGDDWLVPRVKDAPAFSDTAGAWCEAEVSTVYEAGLMEGRSAERFDVTAPLTNAQIAVITAGCTACSPAETAFFRRLPRMRPGISPPCVI